MFRFCRCGNGQKGEVKKIDQVLFVGGATRVVVVSWKALKGSCEGWSDENVG